MPKPEQTAEPSIEEILASIRRIIADDAPAAAVDAAFPDDHRGERNGGARHRPADNVAPRSEDEVLELTEDFMLAEEAPSRVLQEPSEPEEFGESQRHDSHHHESQRHEARGEADPYSDPYDESFVRRASRPEQAAPASHQEESREEAGGMFSAVMAEVRRFTDNAPQKEPPQSAAPAPQENWGQPDMEALTPALSRGSSRPVWSARHKDGEPARVGAEPPMGKSATSEPALGRQPDLASSDNWSRGVQMPVPDAGPATPFPSEEDLAPRSRTAASPAPQPSPRRSEETPTWMPPSGEHGGAASQNSAARQTQQGRVEELADRAVSDFTSDRVGAPTVVADILKGDKPLMDAIASSLASALSRETDEPDEFEEAPHPEDFGDDVFGVAEALPPSPAAEQPAASQPQRLAVPGIVNLDGGFAAQHPVKAKESAPVPLAADQEMPELPRDEPDDMVSASNVPSTSRPAFRPIGIPEPLMPNVPTPATRAPSLPVAGPGTMREVATAPAERLQPASGPKSLEDTIKEMLKPLLMQWLDENMPRIVNEALREEIAANGLLPRAREVRR